MGTCRWNTKRKKWKEKSTDSVGNESNNGSAYIAKQIQHNATIFGSQRWMRCTKKKMGKHIKNIHHHN